MTTKREFNLAAKPNHVLVTSIAAAIQSMNEGVCLERYVEGDWYKVNPISPPSNTRLQEHITAGQLRVNPTKKAVFYRPYLFKGLTLMGDPIEQLKVGLYKNKEQMNAMEAHPKFKEWVAGLDYAWVDKEVYV